MLSTESRSFVLSDSKYFLSCICPKCSGKMTSGVYYIAQKGETKLTSVDNSQIGLKKIVTKTFSTEYRDIRRKTGGICLKCWSEAYRKAKKRWSIIGCAAAATCIGCLIPLLSVLTSPEFAEKTGPFVNLLFILGTIGGAYLALFKALPEVCTIGREIKMVLGDQNSRLTQYRISAVLIAELTREKDTDCAENEVLLNSATVDTMRGTFKL